LNNDVNVPSKEFRKKLFLVGILKITDEKSRIRIRTKISRIHNTDKNVAIKWIKHFANLLKRRLPIPRRVGNLKVVGNEK
jgi:hypothetical protein